MCKRHMLGAANRRHAVSPVRVGETGRGETSPGRLPASADSAQHEVYKGEATTLRRHNGYAGPLDLKMRERHAVSPACVWETRCEGDPTWRAARISCGRRMHNGSA